MTNEPFQLTTDAINEIAEIDEIRDMWGATNAQEMAEFLHNSVYGVKFKFQSACPGYVGDLFILQGDILTGDPPLVLIRDADGKLNLINCS